MATPSKPSKTTLKELSWLSFNERVLQEAQDANNPLAERLKFLGIYSSNMDEFFRVRVAKMKQLSDVGKDTKAALGFNPRKALKAIQNVVLHLNEKFDRTYSQINRELKKNKVRIIDETQLNKAQGEFVRSYFHKEVRANLVPIMLDPKERLSGLKDECIYLAIALYDSKKKAKAQHALAEIPTQQCDRFVLLPTREGHQDLIFLDDVIRYCLEDIFIAYPHDTFEAYTVKFTRDADMDIDIDGDQEATVIKKVAKGLKSRRSGNPVRFIYDEQTPNEFLKFLFRYFKINKEDAQIAGSRYHNFKDFIGFPKLPNLTESYRPQPPVLCKEVDLKAGVFKAIREKDILLHYPYQSFNTFLDLLREAAIDPKVKSIKLTLYRVATESTVMNAVINAIKNGKKVTIVIELTARFDEENNIKWANRLSEEGAKVIYGVPGLKVHSKLCHITRMENGRRVHYSCIGTGNFNESTSKLYTDHMLMTRDKRLTNEVEKIFEFFRNNYKAPTCRHLIVSPYSTRKRFNALINKEIKNAQAGKEAYIIIKLNNLADPEMAEKLYAASQAGVKIRFIIRGMFNIIPGVKDLSENIEAHSIVGRYLEHSRIFVFCNGGDELYFMGSGDWMTRNFDSRVEVATPIYDADLRQQLRHYLELQFQDNIKTRIVDEAMSNRYKKKKRTEAVSEAQSTIYDYVSKQLS